VKAIATRGRKSFVSKVVLPLMTENRNEKQTVKEIAIKTILEADFVIDFIVIILPFYQPIAY